MADEPDEGVICSLCRCCFQDPKLLECLHYYCRKCIQESADKAGPDQPFLCPDCGKPTSIPENGAGDLDTVFFVVRKTELYRTAMRARGEKIQCEECDPESMLEPESPTTDSAVSLTLPPQRKRKRLARDTNVDTVAQFFCQHCGKFICEFCKKIVHRRQKKYKGHVVVTIEEIQQNEGKNLHLRNLPQKDHCKVHQQPLNLYCCDCGEVICRDCLLLGHKDHTYDEIDNCSTQCRKSLSELLSTLSKDEADISNAIDKTEKVNCQISNQVVDTEASVNKAFADVGRAVQDCQQQLLATVNEKCQEKSDVLSGQLKALRCAHSHIQHLTSFVGQCLESGNDAEIISLWKRMTEEIQEEIKRCGYLILEPDAVADIEVDVSRCAKEVEKVLRNHTVLRAFQADPSKSKVGGDGITNAKTNTVAKFMLYTKYHDGQSCIEPQNVTAELQSKVDGSTIQGDVEPKNAGTYEVSYCPKIRGRHELTVCINGNPIVGSPFDVFVAHPPTELCEPVRRITGLKRPYGATFNHEGHLLVTESITSRPDHEATNHIHSSGTPAGIAIISVADGTIIERKAQSRLNNPAGVAVDEDGCVYVINNDNETESVIKYDKDWSFMRCAGKKEDFNRPGRVEISPKNELYICDRANHRIKVYDTNLVYRRLFGSIEFKHPVDIAFDGDGNVYVTEMHGDCVLKLNPDGEKLQQIGKYGSQPGNLGAPRGIMIHQNCIYVCERDNHRVSVFRTDGTFVTAFGAKARLHDPASIVVDKDGFIYVCDEENACVVVF